MPVVRFFLGLALLIIGLDAVLGSGVIILALTFLSPDGLIAPATFMRLRVWLASGIPLGLWLLFWKQALVFLNRIDAYPENRTGPQFILGILSTSLVLHVAIWLLYPFHLWGDYTAYDQLGWNLAQNGCYCIEGIPTAYRPPGYPFFLSLIYAIFGHSPWIASGFNILFSLVALYLAYLIAERLFGVKTARWTLILLAFYPGRILYVNLLASEVIFTFLFLLAIWVLVREFGKDTKGWISALVGGIFLGLAALTRPIIIPVLLIVPIFWIMRKYQIRAVLILTLILFLGFISTVLPWIIRNHGAKGSYTITTSMGINLLAGNSPGAGMGWNPSVVEELPIGDPWQEVYLDSMAQNRAWNYIKDNPAGFVKRGMMKIAYLYAVDLEGVDYQLLRAAEEDKIDRYFLFGIIVQFWHLALIILALGSVFIRGAGKAIISPAGLLTLLLIIYWTMVHFVFYAEGRYHYPIMPFVAMAAALTIISCKNPEEASS